MPEKARAFLKQLTDFWAGLPTPKRIALVFFTTAVLIGVSLLSVLGSRDHFSTLYSELSTEDAAQIVEKLKTQQVPYQLSANGTQILVPEEKVAGLRLELAAGGLAARRQRRLRDLRPLAHWRDRIRAEYQSETRARRRARPLGDERRRRQRRARALGAARAPLVRVARRERVARRSSSSSRIQPISAAERWPRWCTWCRWRCPG